MELENERFFNKKKYYLEKTEIITDRAIADEIAEKIRNTGYGGFYARVIPVRDNEQEYYAIYSRSDQQKIKQGLRKNLLKQLIATYNSKINEEVRKKAERLIKKKGTTPIQLLRILDN